MKFSIKKFSWSFRQSIGVALITSGLALTLAAAIPNSMVPRSFPTLFGRQDRQAVLPAKDTGGVPIFDPSFTVSDTIFRTDRDFPNASSIQTYLTRVKSPLAGFQDQGKTAAQIIFDAARGVSSGSMTFDGKMIKPNVNPALVLTKLETEQSLLGLKNYDIKADPDRRIAKAMGYACYDFAQCDDSKKGFYNQVNRGTWQLEYNYQLATNKGFAAEPYQVGKTLTTLDERKVFLTNAATAAFYRYTPHVYWGNYNVWKIMMINGWGTKQDTYSNAAIDGANLPEKKAIDVKPISYDIKFSAVSELLKRNYQLGTQSQDILKVQRFLRQEGYYTREPNGYYGVITKYALETYRNEQKLGQPAPTSASPTAPATSVPIKANCGPILQASYRSGQTGDEIKSLQQCLRELGLFKYSVNSGKVGAITLQALDAYRTSKGVPTTPTTKPKIDANTCSDLYQRNWRSNQIGDEVRKLQQCLIDASLLKSAVTGKYATLTQAALTKFKSRKPVAAAAAVLTTKVNVKDVSKLDYWGYRCSDLKGQFYQFGQTGNKIKALQTCMDKAGLYDYSSYTGKYWYETDRAFIAWRNS